MKQKIIAIGGGNVSTHKYRIPEIDTKIVEACGKKHPRFLFIPTASSNNADYAKTITAHFEKLGCTVDVLYLIDQKPDHDTIKKYILSADIIYVGGGNTLKMMNLWRKLGIDKLLNQARKKGTVLCGVSAGSICWFNHGNSDSRKFKNPDADFIKVTGLGFIDAFNCPHYNSEPARKASLKKMLQKYPGVAIALEDCAALQITGTAYRIITSHKGASAYKVYWKKGEFFQTEIEKSEQLRPLGDLLKK